MSENQQCDVVGDRQQLDQELRSSLIQLCLTSPCIGTALLHLEPEWEDHGTGAVSLQKLYISTEFWRSLSAVGRCTFLAHEAMHVLLGHTLVNPHEYNAHVMNVAMDAVDNRILEYEPTLDLGELPEGVVRTYPGYVEYSVPRVRYTVNDALHIDWQDIYYQIMEQQPPDEEESDKRVVGINSRMIFDSSPAHKYAYEELKCRAQNSSSASVDRAWHEHQVPKMSLKKVVGDIMSQYTPPEGNLTYGSRPNTRHSHLYYCTKRENLDRGLVSILVDVSSSVNEQKLGEFLSCVNQFLSSQRVRAEVLFFNTEVTERKRLKPGQVIQQPTVVGYGGTDFRTPIAAVSKESTQILIFTDLMGTFPRLVPKQPCTWITVNEDPRVKPPWGQAVYMRTTPTNTKQ